MKMNLQLFAEENIEEVETNEQEEFNVETLNEEQVTKIKEKFGFKDDNDVDSIIKSKRSRWQKELEEEKSEVERLAKLSEEQRQKELFDKERAKFEEERKTFQQQQMLVEKGKKLQEIGISSTLAERIKGDTAEEIMEDINGFKETWDNALKQAVDKALVNSVDSPMGRATKPTEKMDLASMTYEEVLNMKKTNPQAYEQAIKN